MVKIYTATDVGIGRANNEDRFLVVDDDKFVVADGMGGYAAGEVASSIMIERAAELLKDKNNCDEEYLSSIIKDANKSIIETVKSNSQYKGMGTTSIIVSLADNKLVWANVGDSRAYLWRGGVLHQLTQDHSLVADLIKEGSISKDEAKTHPKRNVLTRAVGADVNLEVDTGSVSINIGDIILLCSDGITAVLDDDVIAELLAAEDCDLASLLIKTALEKGSRDNITAVVVDTRNN